MKLCSYLYWLYLHYVVFLALHSSTPVDPLNATNFLCATCVINCHNNVTSIKVIWEAVDCAQQYVLDIFGMESITIYGTSYEASYNMSVTNISGSLYANGGNAYMFDEDCFTCSDQNTTTVPVSQGQYYRVTICMYQYA